MKLLLLLLPGCFLSSLAIAQNGKNRMPDGRLNPVTSQVWVKPLNDTNIVFQSLGLVKPRKPGMYRLPQDNMPCLVPDSTKTVKIPNAWKGPVQKSYRSNPPRIPNPAKPVIPQENGKNG